MSDTSNLSVSIRNWDYCPIGYSSPDGGFIDGRLKYTETNQPHRFCLWDPDARALIPILNLVAHLDVWE